MTLKPLQDRVLIERVDSEKVTAGGIVIPDTAAEKADQGVVLAAGPGKYDEHGVLHAVALQPGDRVLFSKFAGQTVKVDGKEHLILREDDVMAIVVQ
jgi:chaperonin GroES